MSRSRASNARVHTHTLSKALDGATDVTLTTHSFRAGALARKANENGVFVVAEQDGRHMSWPDRGASGHDDEIVFKNCPCLIPQMIIAPLIAFTVIWCEAFKFRCTPRL
jgi:hypothetical protein